MTTCAQATPVWTAPLGNLVNSVAISADGTLVIAATYAHDYLQSGDAVFATYAFDHTGTQKWIQPLDTSSEGVYWVALAGSAPYVAAGGKIINATYPKGVGFIQAYDALTGATLLNYCLSGDNAGARINKVALSANGSALVAVGGSSLYVSTWNDSTYSTPVATVIETSSSNWLDTVAVSDDGTFVVVGASTGDVYLFANAGGTLTAKGKYQMPNGATCRCAVFAPGGYWFAVCGGNSETGGAVCLFNATAFAVTPKPLWTQQARGPLYYVSLPSAGALPPVAAVVTNTPWTIVHAQAGQEELKDTGGQVALLKAGVGPQPIIERMFSTNNAPNSASFDASGKLLGVADGYPPVTGTGDFYLLNGSDLSCRWTFPTPKMSWPIAVAAEGGAVAAGSDDGYVYYFKVTAQSAP